MFSASNHMMVNTSGPDTAWLAAIAAGDQKSLGLLYDKYAPVLLGMIRRTVQDAQVSEEILQSVFVLVPREAHTFDPGKGRVFAWLAGILRRQMASHPATTRASGTEPDMARLTKPALELVLYQGYTGEEAARALGISLESFKAVLRSELNILRSQT